MLEMLLVKCGSSVPDRVNHAIVHIFFSEKIAIVHMMCTSVRFFFLFEARFFLFF